MSEYSKPILSISEINHLARVALETQLPSCWIRGEVSNLMKAGSGHWYLTLKDADASVRCVMFRQRNQFVDWALSNGDQVEVRAQPSLYEPRGDFQLIVEAVRRAGLGTLFEAFLRLKEKLQGEGLFDADRKLPLPALPKRVGVITSPQGAALHDVLTTLKRRWPIAQVIIYPCLVQGDGAPPQIQAALEAAIRRGECQVLLLVRGGGGIEDLWAYNNESLARTIAASPIPIISGIGHETDFTIADFVADFRAPTPTGAANAATPAMNEQRQHVLELQRRAQSQLSHALARRWQQFDALQGRIRHPREDLRRQRDSQVQLTRRLHYSITRQMEGNTHQWQMLGARLHAARLNSQSAQDRLYGLQARARQAISQCSYRWRMQVDKSESHLQLLSPTQVLNRGYSIVRNEQGEVIREAPQVLYAQRLQIQLSRGELGVVIEKINQ